jgi:GH15 family glucan-1,4-alpha-glucosidase
MQIMYERRLTEYEVCWLRGYEDAAPVRIGNAAAGQLQLDVYGEVLDALYQARRMGLTPNEAAWNLERALLEHLENIWDLPDEGLWEVRGGRRQFTHSKVMAWVAFDRAVRSVEEFGLSGPAEGWRRLREQIHADVCRSGFDTELNSFVQSYGAKQLDASLLLLPLVGFLAADDPRIIGTVAAVEKHLLRDCFVARTIQRARLTACPETKVPSSPAVFGLPTTTSCKAGMPTRGGCSSGFSNCATMSGCWRRNTTREPDGRLAISRRRSLTSL